MTIDWWTLGIQAVNVAILVWLLGHFFWRPMAAMIAARRAAVERTLADAEAARVQAAGALADIERTRAGFAAERDAILAAARAEAEQARAALLDQATTEAAALAVAARAGIAAERAAAEQAWADRAGRLAVDIAGRLLDRLDQGCVQAAFLEGLVVALAGQPASVRAAADGGRLEAVSAAPLGPADQAQCRARIAAALGGSPAIDFRVDPSLIAGLELRGANLLVRNSWRADLARILTELDHGERS